MRRLPAWKGTEPYSLGNGDGQWPKRAYQALPKLDAVALSRITAGQRGTGVLDTSRRAYRQLAPERPGETLYHLASHLILKIIVEIKTENQC